MTHQQAYSNLDEMYEDLGLCSPHKITYCLLGEVQSSEIIARPVKIGSSYDAEDIDFVNVGGMLVDRDKFHGHGSVIIEQCMHL
jgi:hypothetical protein